MTLKVTQKDNLIFICNLTVVTKNESEGTPLTYQNDFLEKSLFLAMSKVELFEMFDFSCENYSITNLESVHNEQKFDVNYLVTLFTISITISDVHVEWISVAAVQHAHQNWYRSVTSEFSSSPLQTKTTTITVIRNKVTIYKQLI